MGAHLCHQCGGTQLRRSRRRNFFEVAILPLVLVRPYRCSACHARQYAVGFHKLRRGISRTLLALLVLLGGLVALSGLIYLILLVIARV